MKSNNVAKGKKIASILGIGISTVLVILAFCGRYFDGGLKQFGNFFLGSFGMAFYGMMAAVIVACSFTLAGKGIKIPTKYVVQFALMFIAVVLFIHIFTTLYLLEGSYHYIEYGQYVRYVYNYYSDSLGIPTFGGAVFGSVAYALVQVLTLYGALIVILVLLGLTVYFVGDFFFACATGRLRLHSSSDTNDISPSEQTQSTSEMSISGYSDQQRAADILFAGRTYPEEISTTPSSERFNVSQQSNLDTPSYSQTSAESILFGGGNAPEEPQITSRNSFFEPVKEDVSEEEQDDEFIVRSYSPREEEQVRENFASKIASEPLKDEGWFIPVVTKRPEPETTQPEPEPEIVNFDEPIFQSYTQTQPEEEVDDDDDIIDIADVVTHIPEQPIVAQPPVRDDEFVSVVQSMQVEDEDEVEEAEIAPSAQPEVIDEEEIIAVPTGKIIDTPTGPAVQEGLDFVPRKEAEKKQSQVHKYMKYNKPPFELLNEPVVVDDVEAGDRQRAGEAICNKLAVFGIKLETSNIIVGPSVTRYMFNVLSPKTKMSDFKQYSDDIKACIEAKEDIIIQAPVHGTNQVGIEVPNKVKSPVVLRSLLESPTFQKAKGNLVFAIGQEITGKVITADLAEMPHLLIAGTTGSGKSVALNCLIVSLIYKYGPEYLRFVMVDPKLVELSRYNGIPHMLTTETIVNANDALAGMDYLINEMEARYQLFKENGVGNIVEYNARINPKQVQKLPYLVFIVDELADLMAASKQSFEAKLQRLAQKARAAGIHIVLATQRPDVKTITGTIKANLPARMALKVAAQYDSNTIVNCGGAEKLLGKGDMLFKGPDSPNLERVQGAYVSNDEIRQLVQFSKESNEVYYDQNISDEIFVSRKQAEEAALEQEASKDGANKDTQIDPYCKKALRFWLEKQGGRASIASIQRNLAIGFNRAGRIMDTLQKLKYVEELSPSDPSSKPLKVLVKIEDLDELFPDLPD